MIAKRGSPELLPSVRAGVARAWIGCPLRDVRLYTATRARRCGFHRRRCSRPNQGAHCHIWRIGMLLTALCDWEVSPW